MTTLHPASKSPTIECGTAIAMHAERLCDSLLPTGERHQDLEGRSGGKLRLNCFIQQRLVGIIDEAVPLIPGKLHGEIPRIKRGEAHPPPDLSLSRLHGVHRSLLPLP